MHHQNHHVPTDRPYTLDSHVVTEVPPVWQTGPSDHRYEKNTEAPYRATTVISNWDWHTPDPRLETKDELPRGFTYPFPLSQDIRK